jgi:hypothetical protein
MPTRVFVYFRNLVDSINQAMATVEQIMPTTSALSHSHSCCALELTALERAHAILANSSLCSKHLLKTLQLFRYQNELAKAREESHCTIIAAFKTSNPGQPIAGLMRSPRLLSSSVYFPQEDLSLTTQLNSSIQRPHDQSVLITLIFAHEDYVHKVKRAASAVSKKKNDSLFALFGREQILDAATLLATSSGVSLELKAVTRLMGEGTGVDEMSFAAMKQLFTFRPLHAQVAKKQPAMAEALGVFGDYIDAFDRSGISRATRIASLHRFCDLFDLIMPESFHQRGYMPAFVGGLPSKVWLALRRNADSRLYMFAMFPNVDIIDRALGTFDLEASFSEVVRGAGQYKPYASTCMKIMGKIDYLCDVMRKEESQRVFLVGHANRGSRSQYDGAGGDARTKLEQWVAAPAGGDGRPRQAPKGDTRRLKHAITTFTLVARDFSKLKQRYWAKV